MELRNLRYFLAVADEGSFRRAGEKLHVAQSAVSRRVSDLEHELGVTLIDRLGKTPQLSQAGIALAARTRGLLEAIGAAGEVARDIGRGKAGVLRIGLHLGAVRHEAVRNALRTFHDECPDVQLDLCPVAGVEHFASAQGLGLDAAFVVDTEPIPPPLEHRVVARDGWAVFVPTSHRLAQRKSVRLQELDGESIITLPRQARPELYDRVMARFATRGVQPRSVQPIAGGELQMALASAGLGVALTMRSLKQHVPPSMRMCLLKDMDIPVDVSLLWRGRAASPALRSFLAHTDHLDIDR
jgi:DNA-binding transcriptional LysR family regulator